MILDRDDGVRKSFLEYSQERTIQPDPKIQKYTKCLLETWEALYRCKPHRGAYQKLQEQADYYIEKINQRKIKIGGNCDPRWFIELQDEFIRNH